MRSFVQKWWRPDPKVKPKEPILMENIRASDVDPDKKNEVRVLQRQLADGVMKANKTAAEVRLRLSESALGQMHRSILD